jgi:ABC-type Fe3+-hydroxamate transport system substrate-binding protein
VSGGDRPARVVSLVPSVTETLLAWRVTPVAVTRFCEQPDLPHVGGTKDPDVAAVVALAPDLVVLDEEENRREDAEALAAAGLVLEVLTVRSMADVTTALGALAARLGLEGTVDVPAPPAGPPPEPVATAFVPIWRRPWMACGADTYGSSLLAHLGIANAFAGHPDRYPVTTLEEAAGLHPDLVVAPSEPYPFRERHVDELTAVAPVVLVDGQDLFWWGVRTPAALGRLGERLAAYSSGSSRTIRSSRTVP